MYEGRFCRKIFWCRERIPLAARSHQFFGNTLSVLRKHSTEGRTPDAVERCVRHRAGSRPRDRDLPPRFRTIQVYPKDPKATCRRPNSDVLARERERVGLVACRAPLPSLAPSPGGAFLSGNRGGTFSKMRQSAICAPTAGKGNRLQPVDIRPGNGLQSRKSNRPRHITMPNSFASRLGTS